MGKIAKNTVVSVTYTLTDAQDNLIEAGDEPIVYLHGGYNGIFPKIEAALEGHEAGFEIRLQLEPEEAFGEYDAARVKVEPRHRFPEPLTLGMQFEGVPDENDEPADPLIYTVTDIADDCVVVDGNHPLAGIALRFALSVTEVRAATAEEIERKHAHSIEGLEVWGPEPQPQTSRTLH